MGGVDLSDANVARCRSTIRGKKWYFPLFLYMLDLSVANAWILFRLSGSTMDLGGIIPCISCRLPAPMPPQVACIGLVHSHNCSIWSIWSPREVHGEAISMCHLQQVHKLLLPQMFKIFTPKELLWKFSYQITLFPREHECCRKQVAYIL